MGWFTKVKKINKNLKPILFLATCYFVGVDVHSLHYAYEDAHYLSPLSVYNHKIGCLHGQSMPEQPAHKRTKSM